MGMVVFQQMIKALIETFADRWRINTAPIRGGIHVDFIQKIKNWVLLLLGCAANIDPEFLRGEFRRPVVVQTKLRHVICARELWDVMDEGCEALVVWVGFFEGSAFVQFGEVVPLGVDGGEAVEFGEVGLFVGEGAFVGEDNKEDYDSEDDESE